MSYGRNGNVSSWFGALSRTSAATTPLLGLCPSGSMLVDTGLLPSKLSTEVVRTNKGYGGSSRGRGSGRASLILLEDTELVRTGNMPEPWAVAVAVVQAEEKLVIVDGTKDSRMQKRGLTAVHVVVAMDVRNASDPSADGAGTGWNRNMGRTAG